MKYYGGKSRLGKYLMKKIVMYVNIVLDNYNFKEINYIEPFCGSLGTFKPMIDILSEKEYSRYKINYYASDINKDLILLYNYLKHNEIPNNLFISRKQYESLKTEKSSVIRAIAGIVYSYGGGWFNGYCTSVVLDNGLKRNYIRESYDALNRDRKYIKLINFKHASYETCLNNIKNNDNKVLNIIYCDPPYRDTNKKYNIESFDHDLFWETMRVLSKNNLVFVSELTAPTDFKCVYTHKYSSKINKINVDRDEKIFIHKSLYDLL